MNNPINQSFASIQSDSPIGEALTGLIPATKAGRLQALKWFRDGRLTYNSMFKIDIQLQEFTENSYKTETCIAHQLNYCPYCSIGVAA